VALAHQCCSSLSVAAQYAHLGFTPSTNKPGTRDNSRVFDDEGVVTREILKQFVVNPLGNGWPVVGVGWYSGTQYEPRKSPFPEKCRKHQRVLLYERCG
jgi:hypothetical protein